MGGKRSNCSQSAGLPVPEKLCHALAFKARSGSRDGWTFICKQEGLFCSAPTCMPCPDFWSLQCPKLLPSACQRRIAMIELMVASALPLFLRCATLGRASASLMSWLHHLSRSGLRPADRHCCCSCPAAPRRSLLQRRVAPAR